jgi:hypothetical protein
MLDEGCFDFGSRQPVPRNIDNVIHTATDPVVTLVVASSTVSGELILSVLHR